MHRENAKCIHREFKIFMNLEFFEVHSSYLNKKKLFLKGVHLNFLALIVTDLVPPTVKTTCVT